MYPLEWIERLKLQRGAGAARGPMVISPVVLSLGLTSLLTDISSEMVNSLLPAYVVLHDATLRELAALRPRTRDELAGVKGFGPVKLDRYGDDLLAVLSASA